MAKIPYAVMALKRTQVDEVVKTLRKEGLTSAADWLEAKKDQLYGKRNEDWRPFGGQTLEAMLREEGDEFQSVTLYIENLPNDIASASLANVSKIQVFFIDLFALFLPKYRELAHKLDLLLANSGQRSCLALGFGVTPDLEPLLTRYSGMYKEVADSYVKGSHHRIALRLEDLSNFRNHVGSLCRDLDRPTPGADLAATERFGDSSGRVPRWRHAP